MTYRECVRAARENYLRELIEREPNITHAAVEAGLNRTALHLLLTKYGIRAPTARVTLHPWTHLLRGVNQ